MEDVSANINDNHKNDTANVASRSERISGRLDPALIEMVDEAVEEMGMKNRSEFIRRAVKAYLEVLGGSGDNMVRVRLPPDQLLFARRLIELEEVEDLGELVRTAMRDHIRNMSGEIEARNDVLAYYREASDNRKHGGFVP